MLDETFFRMPVLPTPKSTGMAPVFVKSLTYSTRKDSLSAKRSSFDSNKNMLSFFLIIYLLKDTVEDFMEFKLNLDSEPPLSSNDITKEEINSANCSSNTASFTKSIDENSLDSSNEILSKIDEVKVHPSLSVTSECTNTDKSELNNISSVKKVNKIALLNKNNISKITPSIKGKKCKKNKNKHVPHKKA